MKEKEEEDKKLDANSSIIKLATNTYTEKIISINIIEIEKTNLYNNDICLIYLHQILITMKNDNIEKQEKDHIMDVDRIHS